METLSLCNLYVEDEEERSLRIRTLKQFTLRHFPPIVKKTITKIFDELVCEIVFQQHMEININTDEEPIEEIYINDSSDSDDDSLIYMSNELNIMRGNQDIDCPKCFVLVKCLWLSKHLAVCMNPQQSTYSYSSRNSSRIARQRIQEGFKTSYDDSRIDSDDERIKPKKRNNKGRRNKIKCVR